LLLVLLSENLSSVYKRLQRTPEYVPSPFINFLVEMAWKLNLNTVPFM
jgi:hypothetical protein